MNFSAARGTGLRCRNWRAETLLRLLENVLEVGERPEDLVVYASLGKAARDWEAYEQIVAALKELEEDQTLVLQTGRPVGVLQTHENAPMVVSAINNTVGRWATEETFYQRMREGKTIWGGLTAGAWQYIGRQGVLAGTYELFRAALDTHFGEAEAPHRWVLTAGLGGMGSAQPISAALLGLSSLTVEADPAKLAKQLEAGVLDTVAQDLDAALETVQQAATQRRTTAVGLLGNAAEVFPEVAARGIVPDLVTDQTAAHDTLYGYLPAGYTLEQWAAAREEQAAQVQEDARTSMAAQVTAMLALQQAGAVVFENGNNLRVNAAEKLPAAVVETLYSTFPGFMEAYLRPLFCRGIGPFRWMVPSGSEQDLAEVDRIAAELFPERPEVARWLEIAQEAVPAQGLPARSCWLGYGERAALAVAVNQAVAEGRISAPVAFSRDHLDSAGMTHPKIGTEGMKDDSDGVTDWPILDIMLMSAAGGDMVVMHSGGGGYSGWMQSGGITVVADGSPEAGLRVQRALDYDAGLGVLRHATAGYPEAQEAVAASQGESSHGPALHHIQN